MLNVKTSIFAAIGIHIGSDFPCDQGKRKKIPLKK